ncbi:MAG TPA: hypothetical protein VHA11_13335 [Bryobacteraceae bacterium]|nr:hypothetical protein [Bryobacteraceae bacterium]
MIVFALAAAGLAAQPADPAPELDRVARTASVMVDGDVCRRIQTPRSRAFLLKKDPRDPFAASDNYDVDHAAFLETKKTLMRLAHLCPEVCDVNLWMPVEGEPGRIGIVIRQVHEMSQFWKWGDLHQEMPPEMKRVLATGERVTVRGRRGIVSVLAPVSDSLGDIVGLVEVVSEAQFDPRENVK